MCELGLLRKHDRLSGKWNRWHILPVLEMPRDLFFGLFPLKWRLGGECRRLRKTHRLYWQWMGLREQYEYKHQGQEYGCSQERSGL